MSVCKYFLIQAAILFLLIPVAVFAADGDLDPMAAEEPSFTNPAQAQHAENIAEASFSEFDLEDAKERAQTSYAEDMAESFIEEKAQEYAEGVYEQKAEEYAEDVVVTAAIDHADSVCDKDCKDEDEDDWNDAYQYAYERATGEGYRNLKTTTYENWLADSNNAYIKQEAYDYAKERAYGNFGDGKLNAYQSAFQRFYGEDPTKEVYEEYLTEKVAEITGEKVEVIRRLRYEEKKGWGQIKKMYPVPKGVLGLGHSYSIKLPKDQFTPPAPEELSIDAEIAEVTIRSTTTEWDKASGASTKQKGNAKKSIGLTGTSVAAEGVISETVGGNGKSSNGKSDSSVGSGKSNNSNQSQSGFSTTSNPSGKDKSNNGNSGASSNNGKSGANSNNGKSGASSNNGNSGASSNNGNSGASSNNGNSGASSNNGNSGKSNGNSGNSNSGNSNGNSGNSKK